MISSLSKLPSWLIIIGSGILGIVIQIAIVHASYFLTTYPSDIGMYPLAFLMSAWLGWLIGSVVGAIIAAKIRQEKMGWLVVVVGTLTYPLWCIATIPIFMIVTWVVQVILTPFKT